MIRWSRIVAICHGKTHIFRKKVTTRARNRIFWSSTCPHFKTVPHSLPKRSVWHRSVAFFMTARALVSVSSWSPVCSCGRVRARARACVCPSPCAYACACAWPSAFAWGVRVCLCGCVHACTRVCLLVPVSLCTCACVRVSMCVCEHSRAPWAEPRPVGAESSRP